MPRGLEPGLYGDEPGPKADTIPATSSSNDVISVTKWGSGWIQVKTDLGQYKRSGGSLSWRYHNPGNLKYGDFAKSQGAIGSGYGGHSVFPNAEMGLKAQKALLFTSVRGYNNLSITQAMNKYAPASDKSAGVPKGGNQPNQYASIIAKAAGVPTSTKLEDLNEEQRDLLVKAMMRYEGHKTGTSEKL